MDRPIADTLDALAQWRGALDAAVAGLAGELQRHDLSGDADAGAVRALRERLAGDRLVLAFVAEFSRGKSELINAIFFGDARRRVMPATPGRTTMCPVELRHDEGEPPSLRLLPIETRLRGLSLAELRDRAEAWHCIALDPGDPQALADALAAVTRTRRVPQAEAAALGFWNGSQPEDNPPLDDQGCCEVPAWRHALIHYPHPLLQRGLVVVDTPGLNAVGAEPELTLGLLPGAHATVFVLAADTGVTRSDLAMWRDHLAAVGPERFVVLNKIDALADPLLPRAQVDAQIESQRLAASALLGVAPARVFALSARQALAARIGDDAALWQQARLQPLEQALADELLPRRRELLGQTAAAAAARLRDAALRRVADRRRQQAEQLLELRGLRGKSGAKLRLLAGRVDTEAAEFERCTARLAALRAVHARTQQQMLAPLSADGLHVELAALQQAMGGGLLKLRARAAFADAMRRLRKRLSQARHHASELRQLLQASFDPLNAEFGFAFVLGPLPRLRGFVGELEQIEAGFDSQLGIGHAWRMAAPGFAEQFRRLLLSRVKPVFDRAGHELETWSSVAQAQVDLQLRERRHGFAKRRESLQRVQLATGELEQRIAEIQVQDAALARAQADVLAAASRVFECSGVPPPAIDGGADVRAGAAGGGDDDDRVADEAAWAADRPGAVPAASRGADDDAAAVTPGDGGQPVADGADGGLAQPVAA